MLTKLSAGEFAEAVRDQFLNERIEYYKDLETAIADAAAADGTTISSDMCNQEHVRAGLMHLDPDMPDHTVRLSSNKYTLANLNGSFWKRDQLPQCQVQPSKCEGAAPET